MVAKKKTGSLKKEVEAKGIGKRIKSGPSGEVITSSQPPHLDIETPSSFDIFQRTIKRASNLIETHSDDSTCQEHHLDSFRAAIVLSISALDAYVRTLVVEKILFRLSDKAKDLPDSLKDYIKSLLNQDALLDAGRRYEFREKVEKAIRADFETKSFQGEYRIDFYMGLAGYKDIFEKVSHSANWSRTRLREELGRFTKRRHIIAHCGDFDLTQIPHQENEIEKKLAQNCVEVVQLFAEHLNKVTKK